MYCDHQQRSLPIQMLNHNWFEKLRMEDTAQITELFESEEKVQETEELISS